MGGGTVNRVSDRCCPMRVALASWGFMVDRLGFGIVEAVLSMDTVDSNAGGSGHLRLVRACLECFPIGCTGWTAWVALSSIMILQLLQPCHGCCLSTWYGAKTDD